MSDLRAAAQRALEALENCSSEYGHRCNRCDSEVDEGGKVASALRAALAQQDEPDLSRCPQCNGPADNGFDRSIPPNPYLCTKCMAEPVEPVVTLTAQRDALLEALKFVIRGVPDTWEGVQKARAAIKMVEGTK